MTLLSEIALLGLGTLVAVVLSKLLWRWIKFARKVNKLPMAKLRFYHVLGHATGTLYLRIWKRPLPYHVYDFLLMNGYSYVFRKKSLAALWAFFFPVVQVHRADAVETILNHSTELIKGFTYKFTEPWLGQGLLTSHGTKWKNRRKLLTPAFHFNILKDFLVVFNKQSKIFADALQEHAGEEYVDIVPAITKCSFDIMCETVLGVETHAQTDPFNPYLNSVNFLTNALFERMMSPLIWPDFIFKLTHLGRKFSEHTRLVHEFNQKIISEKKKEKLSGKQTLPKGDSEDDPYARKKRALLDLMLDEHIHNDSLSEADIREEVDTFTFEGHDTTAMGMSWSLYLIGLHPGVQEKIRRELDSIFAGDDQRDVTADDLKDMRNLSGYTRPCLISDANCKKT